MFDLLNLGQGDAPWWAAVVIVLAAILAVGAVVQMLCHASPLFQAILATGAGLAVGGPIGAIVALLLMIVVILARRWQHEDRARDTR